MSLDTSQIINDYKRNPQGTHLPAAQGSAARILVALRDDLTGGEKRSPSEIEIALLAQVGLEIAPDNVINNPQYKNIKGILQFFNFINANQIGSPKDRLKVFELIITLVKLGEDHWTKNIYYPSGSKAPVQIDSSLGETLNLTCLAIFDESAYDVPEGSSVEADTKHRVLSLFQCLLKQPSALCSGGRQHEFLFLLNNIYKPKKPDNSRGEPIRLIEDINSFLHSTVLEALVIKINTSYQNNPEGKFQFVKSWFVRDGQSLHEQWLEAQKAELEELLAQQCAKFGLNPTEVKNKIDGLITNLPYIEAPSDIHPAVLVMQNIFNFMIKGNGIARIAEALNVCKKDILNCKTLDEVSDKFEGFSRVLDIIRNINPYLNITLIVGSEATHFNSAKNNLLEMLKVYFESVIQNSSLDKYKLPIAFDVVYQQSSEALQTFKQDKQVEFIQNFFAVVNRLNSFLERASLWDMLDALASKVTCTDELLTLWIEKNTAADGVVEISPYEINRILLHAWVNKPDLWSDIFIAVLEHVVNWLLDSNNTNGLVQELKNNYSERDLHILLIIICIKKSNKINELEKKKLFNTINYNPLSGFTLILLLEIADDIDLLPGVWDTFKDKFEILNRIDPGSLYEVFAIEWKNEIISLQIKYAVLNHIITDGPNKDTSLAFFLCENPSGRAVLRVDPELRRKIGSSALNHIITDGFYKGASAVYFLCGTSDGRAILKEDTEFRRKIEVSALNHIINDGPDKGTSAAFCLFRSLEGYEILKEDAELRGKIDASALNHIITDGPEKDISSVYFLCATPEGQAILKEDSELRSKIEISTLNHIIAEGSKKGTSAAYFLCGTPEGQAIFKEDAVLRGKIETSALNHIITDGPYKSTSPAYWLCAHQDGRALIKEDAVLRGKIEVSALNHIITDGPYKSASAAYFLCGTPEGQAMLKEDAVLRGKIEASALNHIITDGPNKGFSGTFFLCGNPENQAMLKEDAVLRGKIEASALNHIITDGPNKGFSGAFFLCGNPENQAMLKGDVVLRGKIEASALNHIIADGSAKGVSAAYRLCRYPEGQAILKEDAVLRGKINSSVLDIVYKEATLRSFLSKSDLGKELLGLLDESHSLTSLTSSVSTSSSLSDTSRPDHDDNKSRKRSCDTTDGVEPEESSVLFDDRGAIIKKPKLNSDSADDDMPIGENSSGFFAVQSSSSSANTASKRSFNDTESGGKTTKRAKNNDNPPEVESERQLIRSSATSSSLYSSSSQMVVDQKLDQAVNTTKSEAPSKANSSLC